eukprot:3814789-Prymnesium_polylepis.1
MSSRRAATAGLPRSRREEQGQQMTVGMHPVKVERAGRWAAGSTARSAEVCAWPASKATELALHGKGSHAASSPGAFVRDLVQYAPCA